MPYDEGLVERLREVFGDHPEVIERKMFGGLVFMVYGHMSCGVDNESIMVRVGPEQHAEALAKPYARVMDFTGKPLNGFVYVDPDGFNTDTDLKEWVAMSLRFVTALPPK